MPVPEDLEEIDHDDVDDNDREEIDLVAATADSHTARLDPDNDRPEVGSWWWVQGWSKTSSYKKTEFDRDGKWLGCVIDVGSNYVRLEGVRFSVRMSINELFDKCQLENDPRSLIDSKILRHRDAVRQLMGKIQQVCALLGVPMRHALSPAVEATQALATTSGVEDVKQYGKDLAKAKDKTLPELFKQVEAEHAEMAKWMKADLIPAVAELAAAKGVTKIIKGKIHMVQLYAGLQEELVLVREGEPASNEAKVHLMQRRHYMDEECLARYEAGGMDFKDIKAFDKWIARDENFRRLLPHDRTIVAFRVRRNDKDYGESNTLAGHIRFWEYNKANKRTFLYIRNGHQLWRMATSIEFDENLFPMQEDADLINNDELWAQPYSGGGKATFITGRQRAAKLAEWREERRKHARQLWKWHAAGKPEKDWIYTVTCIADEKYIRVLGQQITQSGKPSRWSIYNDPTEGYERITPEHLYHDDAMAKVAKATMEQNRVAVVVQGLLDRSTCLHPHPPWRIWTAEGFAAGIELVYDVARALTPGERPSWEGYRAQLNKSIRPGCYTLGQLAAWATAMEKTYGDKWRWHGAVGDGPQWIDVVRHMFRDGSCEFHFERDRRAAKWVPSTPGYVKATYPKIPKKYRCAPEHLTCIDAYNPGDFHIFFDDPRTRGEYLQWAPILLAAEDWHHERRITEAGISAKQKKKD